MFSVWINALTNERGSDVKYQRTALAFVVLVISIAFFLLCMGILWVVVAQAEIVDRSPPVFHIVSSEEASEKGLPVYSEWCDLGAQCYWIGACWGDEYEYALWVQGWPMCGELKMIVVNRDDVVMVPLDPIVARWIGDQLFRRIEEALP